MQERFGDLWDAAGDARVITTNGTIRSDGRAVMGRGVARQATVRYVGLAKVLGRHLREVGNHVTVLLEAGETADRMPIVSFPVKEHWKDQANFALIARSAEELVALTEARGWRTVVLPRPGCGNGRLTWAEVAPVVTALLDDRFVVVER
jgi:macro domain-containing protein